MTYDILIMVLLQIQTYGFTPACKAMLVVFPGFCIMRLLIITTILSPLLPAQIMKNRNAALTGTVRGNMAAEILATAQPWQTRMIGPMMQPGDDFWLAVSFAVTPVAGLTVVVGLQIVVMALCGGVIYTVVCKRGGIKLIW
ncbi:hypothetical protein LTR27_003406 [Elasticomyces elasticus]|nr:hypothetical protein LTR27_003406 [Elasticomyces elasticus]